jgi:hypothetical protein
MQVIAAISQLAICFVASATDAVAPNVTVQSISEFNEKDVSVLEVTLSGKPDREPAIFENPNARRIELHFYGVASNIPSWTHRQGVLQALFSHVPDGRKVLEIPLTSGKQLKGSAWYKDGSLVRLWFGDARSEFNPLLYLTYFGELRATFLHPVKGGLSITYPTSDPHQFALTLPPGTLTMVEIPRIENLSGWGLRSAEVVQDGTAAKLLITSAPGATVAVATDDESKSITASFSTVGCGRNKTNCRDGLTWRGTPPPPVVTTTCRFSDIGCLIAVTHAAQTDDHTPTDDDDVRRAESDANEPQNASSESSPLAEFAKGFLYGLGMVAKVYVKNKPEIDRARSTAKVEALRNQTSANLEKAKGAISRGDFDSGQKYFEASTESSRKAMETRRKGEVAYTKAQEQREEQYQANLAARDKKWADKRTDELEAAIANRVRGEEAPNAYTCLGSARNINNCGVVVHAYYCPGGGSECSASEAVIESAYRNETLSARGGSSPMKVCPKYSILRDGPYAKQCIWTSSAK